ncbi:MAG: SigB/SigF/SigG family RNA polymerase sigma factor [Solirubrobacteraceae bacterium]
MSAHPAASRERWLFEEYARTGSAGVRGELVERFLPLARRLAGRYGYSDEPFDDLVQVASLGLIKAIDRFDPAKGTRFSSFAVPTILGELKRHFRDRGWALHVPRTIQDRTLRLTRATERLGATLGRAPTAAELADALDLTLEEVIEAEAAASAFRTDSLDAPGDEDGAPLVDLIGADDEQFALVDERTTLAVSWRRLPRTQRQVLRLRFAEDLTQREIGERIGYSQMHVSRLLREAIANLQRG